MWLVRKRDVIYFKMNIQFLFGKLGATHSSWYTMEFPMNVA